MVGCGNDGTDSATGQEETNPSKLTAARSDQAVVLAVHPYASAVVLARQFAPLLDHLSRHTGRPFTLTVSLSYEAHIDSVGGDEVDIALMGPASYVTMVERFGRKELLCCFEVNGSPVFHGYIIARKDNPASTLADLQGLSFASASRNSTMSYVVPRYMFIEAGVSFPEPHLQIVGSHNNVCLNVLAGDVDAGGVREKAYQKYEDRELKVLARSPAVTEHPFVATGRLDPETHRLVRRALLDIKSPEDVELLLAPLKDSLTGLVPIDDEDYDTLRAMLTTVREDEEQTAMPRGDG